MKICDQSLCVGCGMCANVCPREAITMEEGAHGFVFPYIHSEQCIKCGLCAKKCPANVEKQYESTIKNVYAAWNKKRSTRIKSTSGGICSLLEDEIFHDGGVAVGVKWGEAFCTEYAVACNAEAAEKFRGSKYIQANTGDIYLRVKGLLDAGKEVLFTGTPCQVAALKAFLGEDYSGLFTIDLICHGVPSYACLKKFLDELSSEYGRKVNNVRLRYKSPYWDYCSVRVDFENGARYQKNTVDDPYFILFNIGFSLRESCHTCRYTTIHREGDITLADFWGYRPSGFKMRDYNKGTSLVLVNTDKGDELFERIKGKICFETSSVGTALTTNNSLTKPFSPPYDALIKFWDDFDGGELSTEELQRKYVPKPFKLPNLLFLRRLKRRYSWVVKSK